MLTEAHAQVVLSTLKDTLTLPKLVKGIQDPFETLIITIISQNTSDTNTERAFERLSKHFKITPQSLAHVSRSEIEDSIRAAGLGQKKAKTIQIASIIILEKFGGSLRPVLSLPLEEARKVLMEIPGVGPKTADVVLLFSEGKPTIPIDTHVDRVSRRIGLAPVKGGYEDVRVSLQSLFKPEDYLSLHLLLIAHGRKTCKANNPHCSVCLVNLYCLSKEVSV